MKAIVTRQSGETGTITIDLYPMPKDTPTEVLEAEILKTFNSFEGVRSSPFTSIKILNREAKALESKMKNKL